MTPPTGPGHYLRDIVYGALDGGVTTLAIVAGASGAGLGARVAIILGLANLAGDGISMAAGNYLGMRSDIQQSHGDVRREKPWRHGLATFLAFLAAGSVPLLAFLVPTDADLAVAAALTLATMFVVGSLRARFIARNAAWLGLEMAGVAFFAGGVALGVGVLARNLI